MTVQVLLFDLGGVLALERLGVPASAVMFFDDVQANVDAAAALGIRAFRVDGVEGVRERLVREQLLEAVRG